MSVEIQVKHHARQVARHAEILLERMGWAVDRVDLDLVQGRAVLVFKRRDGLVLSFDARGGDASLSRDMAILCEARSGPVWEYIFLGRTHWKGRSSDAMRGHLKRLAHYLADNALTPCTRLESKIAIRALMTASEMQDG